MLVVRILYYALALSCLILSGYLSYKGYLYHVGEMTPFFVAMIIISLLMCDIALQVRREAGDRIGLILLAMTVPIALSGLSNFNHLYTLFKRDDVVRETLTESFDTFRSDLEQTRAKVAVYPPLVENAERRATFETELEQVRIQALDPNNWGCATLCREHMDNVDAMLGGAMTSLRVPSTGASLEDFQERFDTFYATYRDTAWATFEAERTDPSVQVARELLTDIETNLSVLPSVQAHIADGGGADILQKLVETSRDIEGRANALPGLGAITHSRIDVLAAELGQIPRTIQNAFFERPDPVATTLSILFAISIDLFPVLMVLALLRPGDGRVKRTKGSDLGDIAT